MSAPEVWGAYVSTARRAGKEHETSSNDCGSITCTWDARGGIVASAHYSRRVHSHWLLVLCFACLPLSATADPSGPSAPHVRPTDAVVRAAVARGLAQSPTFRHLVARLEASDVIVHVTRRHAVGRPFGFTQFVSATAHARYLRITLDVNAPTAAVVALLGHELRHALEAADAPHVRDQSSYHLLYREIGRASCEPPHWCFDTTDAVEAGAQVYAELKQTRHAEFASP
jgi:hypothetical protein